MRNTGIMFFKNCIKVCVAAIISLGILSVFCMVYSNSGIHIQNDTGATDYKWESNQYKASMTEGFAWMTMDENGFNNAYPQKGDVDILLMGSSHMEAVNVQSNKNAGYLLNEYLPSLYTYNIGTSGHTIYVCANNLRAAVDTYEPQGYVIIETDRIVLDCQTMESIMEGSYTPIKSYDSGMMYYLQKYIPVIKNVYRKATDWWSADQSAKENKGAEGEETCGFLPITDSYVNTLNRFLAFIQGGGADSQIIILYQPSTLLDSDGSIVQSCDEVHRELFSQLCEKNGIVFVDVSEAFAKLYEEQHILAHGFTNTAVGVGHLNEYGHRAVAQLLAQTIEEAK